MMRRALLLTLALGVIVNSQSPASSSQEAAAHTVEVINTLAHERPSETISISAGDLKKALAVDDLRTVRVRDEKTAADLLTQAIDTNDDGAFDELIFQADFAPRETRRFTLSVGERRIARKDEYRAYGRFNRERRDDFAWENDRVAHRMYGAALETWKQEPLTSSGLDVWVKRTPRLIINDWYMVDDYHRDTGEGADLYSVGRTRGCGGSGLWVDGKLYSAANFRNSRVLANGPLRVMFELMYEPFEAAGSKVTEMKRITLDAGHHLNRVEIVSEGGPPNAALAAGIRKNPGSLEQTTRDAGILRTWEPIKQEGHLGCAVIVPALAETREADGNHLAIAAPQSGPRVYFAGSAWDRGGHIKSIEEWDTYLMREAARRKTPVRDSSGALNNS